ncbi:hypothetical protein B0A48_01926 [Cryoendolithus antarcticus]|uniref:Maltose/galactoside acetyltransferase domain-containing protein n=1 Tax=Cryoendolithus antarcticus TaxID=1507870 RepID=A0A1V8TQP9_9PEZI|nr:hypothetical protein B0A48_01926 [Cryoendolithus antarcticus]
MSTSENSARALRGEMYYAFTPELVAARRRCAEARHIFNNTAFASRRKQIEMWNEITNDKTPLPPPATSEAEDEALLSSYPWVEAPFYADYGTNIHLGSNVYINTSCTMIDTCPIYIGARTLFAPNVHLYSGTHPLDPEVRNGTAGPEMGGEIRIGEDCWLGGGCIVLPGITIGRGSTVGAGSVVTKDVPEYTVVAGNPASVIKQVPRRTDEARTSGALAALERDQAAGK